VTGIDAAGPTFGLEIVSGSALGGTLHIVAIAIRVGAAISLPARWNAHDRHHGRRLCLSGRTGESVMSVPTI
jgi:hypothetical protein